jgi:outer membrane protein assembly factor BamB
MDRFVFQRYSNLGLPKRLLAHVDRFNEMPTLIPPTYHREIIDPMKTVLLAAIATSILSVTAHADWPEFRGSSGNGLVREAQLPLHWSPSEHVQWRTELPGEGWSSPVVVGNKIYMTAAIATDDSTDEDPTYELSLLVVDATSGQVIARTALFTDAGAIAPRIHQKNSHASPTPLIEDGRVYLHFGHQGTACTDLDGKVQWRNDSLGYPPVHGNGGSPALVGDLLIFSRDGADISVVTALNKMTGDVEWESQRDVEAKKRFSFCTPLVLELNGQTQLILPGSNVVQSLDPASGREIWRLRYDGYSVIPKPIYESGLVFVCTGYDRPSLLAIDPTGSGDVTETHLAWTASSASIPHTPSLVALDGKVAMISDKGIAAAYDARTGRELWKERIGGNYSASPVLVGSHMYLLSEEGDCTILDIADTPKELAKNKLGERTLASPAVVDQDLILRTAQALYRISK